jgi:hypothetical protein
MSEHPPDSEWFQRQLGERWQTAGDGIYRLADERPADTEAGVGPDPAEPELVDDLEPFREQGSSDAHDAAPPTRRRRWLRR